MRRFASAAPAAIEQLAAWGARFDRDADGRLELGQEAAHRRRRIVHAEGDGSGREMMRALIAAVRRTPSIVVLEGAEARRLVVEDGRIRGVVVGRRERECWRSRRTPSCWRPAASAGSTTSAPTRSAASARVWRSPRAPARRSSTSNSCSFIRPRLQAATRPAPLITEAVRGEGAILVDDAGERFMADIPGREMAARDVVARAIWRQRRAGRRVFLDARAIGARFASRFPSVSAICAQHGVDPTRDLIPVRPAAHYHMGGDRGRPGRPQFDRGTVGVRRGRLHRPARRQSPRQQFPDRSGRRRRLGRRRHRRRDRDPRRAASRRLPPAPRPIRPAFGARCPPPPASNATRTASAPESTRFCRSPTAAKPARILRRWR